MKEWGFSTTKKQDTYESIIDKLNPCSSDEFNIFTEEQKDMFVLEMIKEIRKILVREVEWF